MTLNERNEALMKTLPPTDSRLRPDMQFLEVGQLEEASKEKERLEEKQRSIGAEGAQEEEGGVGAAVVSGGGVESADEVRGLVLHGGVL